MTDGWELRHNCRTCHRVWCLMKKCRAWEVIDE